MTAYAQTATELLVRLARRETTAEEICEALFRKIDAAESLHSFSVVDRDRAMAQARASDLGRSSGVPLGTLHGVPLAIKDNIALAGLPNTGGTPALAKAIASVDAEVVRRLKAAGAIVIGKNTMHELAWGTTSINPFSGTPRNPWDRGRTAGGSSGGAGAAVAAGLVPVAIGTDTGGSIRIPAALCGVWGFRPTTGTWPQHGIVPISSTRDTPGPLARSAEDLALLHAAVTGKTGSDSAFSPSVLRIGIPRQHFWEFAQTEVAALCHAALERLRNAGVELVPIDIGDLIAHYERSSAMISFYEGRVDLEAYLAEFAPHIGFAEVIAQIASPDVQELMAPLLDPHGPFTRDRYEMARTQHRPQLQRCYADLFAENRLDVIAFPTCNMPAFRLGDEYVDLPGLGLYPAFPATIHNTGPGSNAGLPGISIPVGKTLAGLPVGLAMDGPEGQDLALLDLAKFIASQITLPERQDNG